MKGKIFAGNIFSKQDGENGQVLLNSLLSYHFKKVL